MPYLLENERPYAALVIDDNEIVRDVLSEMLILEGVFKISEADNGEGGLKVVKSIAKPDIIFCDLQMPEMDGVEFLRHLTGLKYDGAVVMMSGEDERILASVEALGKAHNLNILAAIEKPITPDRLENILNLFSKPGSDPAPLATAPTLSKRDLNEGLESGALVNFYQPKVSLASHHVKGVEALTRFRLKNGTLASPNLFIPLAEKHDLIDLLTMKMVKQAIEDLAAWQKRGISVCCSANFAMDSFLRLQLPEFLFEMLEEKQMDSSRLTIEITEGQVMGNARIQLETLARLRLRGIRLSIDDFGTGYATFTQLKRIPFQELKLDRSFVTDASKDRASRAIVEATVTLAHELGMTTVAEGVETEEELAFLEDLQVEEIQGFLISKPVSADDFAEWYLSANPAGSVSLPNRPLRKLSA